jgi:hypothetical protein
MNGTLRRGLTAIYLPVGVSTSTTLLNMAVTTANRCLLRVRKKRVSQVPCGDRAYSIALKEKSVRLRRMACGVGHRPGGLRVATTLSITASKDPALKSSPSLQQRGATHWG